MRRMPVLDHFRPPLSQTHLWRDFHGAWAAAIARLLNAGVLPAGYYAVPFLDRDGPIEIDVAALRETGHSATEGESVAPAWEPTAPAIAIEVEWPSVEDVRVEIFADPDDPRLAAAIELVSPRNKDRPRAREAFVSKCVDHLRHGRGLVVVDVVTTRRADLHGELLAALGVAAAAGAVPTPVLSATSYKPVGAHDQVGQLLAWTMPLEIGQALATAPLWLAADLAVPLDLEASHSAACADLRIRHAGQLGQAS